MHPDVTLFVLFFPPLPQLLSVKPYAQHLNANIHGFSLYIVLEPTSPPSQAVSSLGLVLWKCGKHKLVPDHF